MTKRDVTFSISEEVMEMLESRMAKDEHDDFVEKSIRSRITMMEEKERMSDLVQHNNSIMQELDAIDADLELGEAMMDDDEFLSDDELSASDFADMI